MYLYNEEYIIISKKLKVNLFKRYVYSAKSGRLY